jgi:hypothetical protein
MGGGNKKTRRIYAYFSFNDNVCILFAISAKIKGLIGENRSSKMRPIVANIRIRSEKEAVANIGIYESSVFCNFAMVIIAYSCRDVFLS